jgi:hypothetical protein
MHAPAKMGHYANPSAVRAGGPESGRKTSMPRPKANHTRCPNLPEVFLDNFDKSLSRCPNALHFAEKPIIHSLRPI